MVQDAFEQLHRLWRLRSPSSALDYAHAAVLNGCRSVLRRRLVARRCEGRIAGPTPYHADAAVVLEQRTELIGAFRSLLRRQREVLESRLIGFPAAVSGVRSAMITSGGREIVPGACHDTSPPGHPRGSVTARIIELSAADGQLLSVLRTQTARYTNVGEQDYLDGGCALLSADPSGSHLLVQDFGFGRLDHGVFTALQGASPDVTFAAAGW